jgi:serine/threonine protein phosphatase PrpC
MPVTELVRSFRSAAATHAGHERPSNQDALLELPQLGLWVIADGMGGYRAGDVASRMVCEALAGFRPGATFEDSIDALRQHISDVNHELYSMSIRAIAPVQSGSTVVMLLAQGDSCAALWAGDSRVYRLRDGQLVQITMDHSWAAELQLRGIMGDPMDHTISRAVGGEATLLLDVKRDRVLSGDRYLLCSDGLYRELSALQMAALMAQGEIERCTQALLEATLATAARDNVTLIVVEAS